MMFKLLKLFKILYKLKINLSDLPKSENLILDSSTGIYYKKFFPKTTFILNTRYEELYFKIFILAFFKWLKSGGKTLNQIYILNVIDEVNPKNIITFTDYNPFFLSIKKFFKEKKIILIQAHARSYNTLKTMLDNKKIYNLDKKFIIDTVLIWGKHYKKYYSQFLNTKFVVTGSFKNYIVEDKKIKENKKSVIYISQYRKNPAKDIYGRSVEEISNFRKKLLENLWLYCKDKKLKFKILSNYINDESEKQYFKTLLNQKKFGFIEKKHLFGSYESAQKYKYFFSESSSLGLELYGIGKYVCSIRLPSFDKRLFLNDIDYKSFKEDYFSTKLQGTFWSYTPEKKEVYRVLNFIINSKKKEVLKSYKRYFDPYIKKKDNKSPKFYLNRLGVFSSLKL